MCQHEFSSEEARAAGADKYSGWHFFFYLTSYCPAWVHEMGQSKADQEVFCEAAEISLPI